jgi:dTDP-4-amino-4,6-dideoxygalactose transaminase
MSDARRVPFNALAPGEDRPEIDAAIRRVIDSGWFVLGPEVETFEAEFAAACGAAHAVGVGTGTDAITLILRALGIGPGDEVITPPLSAAYSALAVMMAGARPVFADIDPARLTLDPAAFEAAITPRTRAVLPVHLYGQPADMTAILTIAARHRLAVVEDAAQAHLATSEGRPVGTMGVAGAFSFYPTKNLGAFGDAGMVVTRHDHIADRLRRLRNLGSSAKNQHDERGFNRRLDTLQAAVLRVKLRHLDDANEARRRVAGWYEEALGELDLTLPRIATWALPVFHLYVIETDDRDALAIDLADQGVHTGVHYPVPIHLQPAFRSLGLGPGTFPVSEELAGRILSLPMHPGMGADEVDHVAEAIRRSRGTHVRRILSDVGGTTDIAPVSSPPLHAG